VGLLGLFRAFKTLLCRQLSIPDNQGYSYAREVQGETQLYIDYDWAYQKNQRRGMGNGRPRRAIYGKIEERELNEGRKRKNQRGSIFQP